LRNNELKLERVAPAVEDQNLWQFIRVHAATARLSGREYDSTTGPLLSPVLSVDFQAIPFQPG